MDKQNTVGRSSYVGIFMVSLATLMYEILLTRIFSVTMMYHFAFMAISVAMFGMTAGAVVVYLLPGYFTQERAKYHLALSSFWFSISIIFSFLTHACIPFVMHYSIVGFYSIILTYVVISIPFFFSGICICLALTKFSRQVSKLYAADLMGAGIGCVLLVYVLKITDGPTAVIAIASLASIASIFFANDEGYKKIMRRSFRVTILLVAFTMMHTVLVNEQVPLLRLVWIKQMIQPDLLYEKWNSFSRIAVWGNPYIPEAPYGWGISSVYPPERKTRQLHMDIDACAYTPIPVFTGNLNDLDYLKYDITNLVHYIRPDSKVFIIGTGGGRDVLSALMFNQKSIVGVEINEDIIDVVTNKFGDLVGHPERDARVTFVNDEARSYIARQKEEYDIIQASLIDTWAATAAGAYVLSENSLYTVEAWENFLQHLTPRGVLTFSRWFIQGMPGETYRLTSLASSSLKQVGIDNPRDHVIIVRRMLDNNYGVATMLLSKEPFSKDDLDAVEKIARKMKFDIVLSPRFSLDPVFEYLTSGKDIDTFAKKFPLNIAAPTDNTPFFFHMLRLKDVFNRRLQEQGITSFNMKAVVILVNLLAIVIILTFLCIIVPLIISTKKTALRGCFPYFLFFFSIGLGFMFIEISQMQRLIIFLGHPTYGLSVVLFTLLLSSGLGSYSTQKINILSNRKSAVVRLLLLLGVLAVFGKLTPYVIDAFKGSTTMFRIFISALILFPLGLFMGMPFPLGMKTASVNSSSLTPWLWGINGATSVCASVLAVVIALSFSISTTFWTGFSCYIVAFIAFFCVKQARG
ncbi:MAG: hypothetical protein JRI96_14500 [Deltaproteobacteria bacterium]|nr:hypothetical protein [Deltaproteobacteria bacterium]